MSETNREPERYIQLHKVPLRYGDSTATIRQKIAAGEIVAIKSGATTLVDVKSLEAHYGSLPRVGGKTEPRP